MISTGGMSRPVMKVANATGMPANPRNLTKMRTPQINAKIIAVSLAVSKRALRKSRHFIRLISAITNTTKAPSAPASVGVAQPRYMPEKIIATTKMIGNVPGSVLTFRRHETAGMRAPRLGQRTHIPTMMMP